ncbi:MAG: IPT/TIG domain-containing protein [Phycisphaerae bacterium]|nr:IPT/TIG domain-containing protein [Phycisphaerae bacterium]
MSVRAKSVAWAQPTLLAILLMIVPVVQAQQGAPHLGYVYPAGGRQGTTFQTKIGGRFLDGVTNLYISGGGIGATVVEQNKPLTPAQINTLREKLQELQKKERDAVTLKEMAEIRDQIAASVKRNANPALGETVTIQVTMAPDAIPGDRELRLGTPLGLSNPLIFRVGRLPEFCENESKNGQTYTETVVTLPATLNGRIVPTDSVRVLFPARQGQQFQYADADRYRFQAHQGQQLVVVASARELIPYLADAVPGWFQAVVTLYDGHGKELAYDDDYRFHPDPVLHYVIPQDGDYIIEIKDAIYRGREDFVYRITLGELPFVTSIFPLGGPAGTATPVEIKGWNLPVDKLTMDAKDKGPGIYPLSVSKGEMVSNHVPVAVDTLPECIEKESNDSPQSAQPVTLPIIVNGHIDKSGDWDVFRFDGHAGDQVVAEVYARRLDSPLDSVLKLTDAAGRQLAFNDDYEDKGSGLNTHHADSFILTTLPADGAYYLQIGDAQHQGGLEYAYRLRISTPRPDFELRVVPSAIRAGAGQTVPITVYALRKDGFSGDIALVLKGVPQAFRLSGGTVPAHQDQVRLTLTVQPIPLNEPLSLGLQGRATIQGREVVRQAVPADDMMQAFAYRHLVPAKDLKVTVLKRGAVRMSAAIVSELPVKIPLGGTARVRVTTPPYRAFDKIQMELSEPPEGITVRDVSSDPKGTDIVLQSDAAKTKPALRGNLIVEVSGERTPPSGDGKPKVNRQRIPLGTLPAIPFEIVKQDPAVEAQTTNPSPG